MTETIVAASLLSLLLIAVLNLLPSALVTVSYAQERRTAGLLAQDSLNLVASRPFASLVVGTQDTSEIEVPANMTLRVTVSEVDHYAPDLLKRITSEVVLDYRGEPRTFTQELYVHPAKN